MTPREEITAERSGVYRTPADVDNLRERAVAVRLTWLESDLARVRSKVALLSTLAAACDFPPSFGVNWDALADSLGDVASRPGKGWVLRLRSASAARQALGADWNVFLDVLRAAAGDSLARGRPFITFLDDAPSLPEWE